MEYLLALAADPAAWIALATLIAMEVVLGIDNLIFISILSNKLPEDQRERARKIGIGLALIGRLCTHLGWQLAFEPNGQRGTTAILDLGAMLTGRKA